MLLLNGGFMSIASWEPYVAPLAGRYRVLRCDLRGQLLTPGPAHRELGANVADVVALLDHLGLERVHVLGTSLGGEVALLLAARRPERVASVVAATVSDATTEPLRRGNRRVREVLEAIRAGGDRGRFHDALVGDVYSAGYVEAEGELLAERRRHFAALPDGWFAAVGDLLAAVEDFDLRRELGAIRCPVLVALAAGDRVMPPARGRAVAAAIRRARVVEHPTSGHGLVLEDPEWLLAHTLAFLEEHRG